MCIFRIFTITHYFIRNHCLRHRYCPESLFSSISTIVVSSSVFHIDFRVFFFFFLTRNVPDPRTQVAYGLLNSHFVMFVLFFAAHTYLNVNNNRRCCRRGRAVRRVGEKNGLAETTTRKQRGSSSSGFPPRMRPPAAPHVP